MLFFPYSLMTGLAPRKDASNCVTKIKSKISIDRAIICIFVNELRKYIGQSRFMKKGTVAINNRAI